MKQRILGQNGPKVSVVGYGAMSFTDFYGRATDEGSMQVLDACLEFGINHVDTSNVYGMGRSETVIGEWLKRRGGECPFTIATKGACTRDDARTWGVDARPERLNRRINNSLRRLEVERIDLYQLRDIFFHLRRRSCITAVSSTGTLELRKQCIIVF